MVTDAENSGILNKNTTLVEPTSGNMGIALAFVCAIKKYKLILTMPESMSIERRKLVKYFGADLVLTKKELGFQGAINKAHEIAKEIGNGLVLDQYSNPSNYAIHKKTGEEIYNQLNGNVDLLIAGAGTGACISGMSYFIKSKKNLHTICVEPEESNILQGGDRFSPHALQGIGPNFLPENFKRKLIDEIYPVSKKQAYNTCKLLAEEVGIMSGISGGACAACAFEQAKRFSQKTILFMIADSCERYVSTDLFHEGERRSQYNVN